MGFKKYHVAQLTNFVQSNSGPMVMDFLIRFLIPENIILSTFFFFSVAAKINGGRAKKGRRKTDAAARERSAATSTFSQSNPSLPTRWSRKGPLLISPFFHLSSRAKICNCPLFWKLHYHDLVLSLSMYEIVLRFSSSKQ